MSRYDEYYEDAYDRASEELGDTDYAADIARDEANRQVQQDYANEEAHKDWQDSWLSGGLSIMMGSNSEDDSEDDLFPPRNPTYTISSQDAVVLLGVACVMIGGSWIVNRFRKPAEESTKTSNLEEAMRDLTKTMEDRR